MPVAAPVLSAPVATAAATEAERRQLTVMFCDLVGSTALSTGMDPEDLRDVIASYQNRCSVAIRRYDGFVAKYMGDGILVYFGYPRAHEDEAERSVRAGLDIVDAMAELNAAFRRPPGVELAVRIGIATGPVIVGDQIGEGTASETAVVGETPNRLRGARHSGGRDVRSAYVHSRSRAWARDAMAAFLDVPSHRTRHT